MPRHKIDPDAALETALGVFWQKGYEGTSYADLVEAVGVERPSLYMAFGNKEALFRRALGRYAERYGVYAWDATELPTAREVAEAVLFGSVDLSTRFADRLGCFGINSGLAGSDTTEPIRKALIEWRGKGEAALRERFQRARKEGDLPEDADPEVLAAYLMAVTHGLAVQAKAGFDRDKLLAIARQALATWPA